MADAPQCSDAETQRHTALMPSDPSTFPLGRIISQTEELRHALTSLREAVDGGQASKESMADMLCRMEQITVAMQAKCITGYKNAHGHEPPTKASTEKAAKVFGTAELLEMILLSLEPFDLLHAQSTARCFDAAIKTSPSLRFHMFLEAAPENSNFRPVFQTGHNWHLSPGPSVHISRQQQDSAREKGEPPSSHLDFHILICDSTAVSLELGDRCRSMLVCQPPLKTMTATMPCEEGCPFLSSKYCARFIGSTSSGTGVTIGEIHEMTDELRDAHSLCSWALATDHDMEGELTMMPNFEAVVKLRRDDPFAVKYLADEQEKVRELQKSERDMMRVQAYVARKAKDHHDGLPILAMWEYEMRGMDWQV